MTTLRVRVHPGSNRDEVSGWDEEVLMVRLRARAMEGRANRSLLVFLAGVLGLRPRQVNLLKGEKSREKVLEVDLPGMGEVVARLRAYLWSDPNEDLSGELRGPPRSTED